MKICIFGAGAIGGFIGARLALAGEDVTLIARGPHLAAMKKNGLKLISEGKTHVVHPRCTDDASEAGPQDFVVLSGEAPRPPGIARAGHPLPRPTARRPSASRRSRRR